MREEGQTKLVFFRKRIQKKAKNMLSPSFRTTITEKEEKVHRRQYVRFTGLTEENVDKLITRWEGVWSPVQYSGVGFILGPATYVTQIRRRQRRRRCQ